MKVPEDQPTPQLDLQAALNWIDILHGGAYGLVHLCAFGDWEGRSFDWDTEREAAAAYISNNDQRQGVYLRVTTLRDPLEPGKRGSDIDSATFPGLWADMDLAGPGHKTTKRLPAEINDAIAILRHAQLPEPTVWIHSGGGLYPMWLIEAGTTIKSRHEFEQLRALSTKWQDVIAYAAEELGFHYGSGVGDLSRVLRLPGTINRKEGLARPCRVLEDTWGRGYRLDELKDALVSAVQRLPEPAPVPDPALRPPARDGLAPGDDYENRTTWAQILEPAGWTWHHRRGSTDYWVRPGKDRRDGHSATTGHDPARDRLFVMSTETDFPAWEPITKFHAYALLHHHGDHKAAARDLGRQGFGDQRPEVPRVDPKAAFDAASNWSNVDSPVSGAPAASARVLARPKGVRDYTTSGAAVRFVDQWGKYIRYVEEEKSWRVWSGTHWEMDRSGSQAYGAFLAMTEDMIDEARAMADDDPFKKSLTAHTAKLRNLSPGTVMSAISGHVSTTADVFDADPRYMNLRNGVYDMVADEFLPHDPKYMLTKVAGVSYDPDAKAPQAEAFFTSLLPSEPMREFTLQALGYALTGEADRKALFVLQGMSNSGKTQVAELGQAVFGDYAVSVSPGTFTKRRDTGPNPELHDMRGARFVYTSETSHEIQLDEELVKRITGKDTMSTRTLYERNQRWIPQCTVWIATNNLPRLASDSEAMWRRVKTIRFPNVFTDDGSTELQAIPNIGRTIAREEGSGLFNLLLEALRRYRAAGRLAEPEELRESVAAHRRDTDPLVQWVSVVQEKGQLVQDPGAEANIALLRREYSYWCHDQGCGAMAAQRFGAALAALLKYDKRRTNGETLIIGWRWSGASWHSSAGGEWHERE